MTVGQDEAVKANFEMVTDVTVVMLTRGETTGSLGSGVLLAANSGRAYVLTAAHTFEGRDWRPVLLGATDQQRPGKLKTFRDAVVDVLLAPRWRGRDVDVALLSLSDEADRVLRLVALGCESIAEDAMQDVERPGMVSGYPGEKVSKARGPGNIVELDPGLVHYNTVALGVDEKGQLRIGWEPSPPPSRRFNHDFSASVVDSPLVDPSGMSGGGFWKYVDARPGEVWSARRHGRLVGVMVSWNDVRRTEAQVESVESFGEWLRRELSAR